MLKEMADHKTLVVYPPILQRARDMRHPLTHAEARIWTRVRNRQLGFKIRRQHPIHIFIADFYCNEAKLVIEIDGDTHSEPDQAEYYAARTVWLEDHGYCVIRFDNYDVYHDLEAVLSSIYNACVQSTAPSPSGRGPG